MGYKIASFNLRRFGDSVRIDGRRALDKIYEIISKERFDIVALQEVFSMGRGVKHLLESYFPDYWGVAISQSVKSGESFAYIWNKRIFKLAENSEHEIFEPHILNEFQGNEVKANTDFFSRVPFYARFIPVGGGFFEIRLINVHLNFKTNKPEDVNIRKKEYEILVKEVFPGISTKRIYGNNREAVTIVLGDYNLNINIPRGEHERKMGPYMDYKVYEYCDGTVNQRIETVQHELTTLSDPEKEETGLKGYANNYDHFTIDTNDLQRKSIKYKYRRIDAVRKYYKNDENQFQEYSTMVSDHVPIVLELDFNQQHLRGDNEQWPMKEETSY